MTLVHLREDIIHYLIYFCIFILFSTSTICATESHTQTCYEYIRQSVPTAQAIRKNQNIDQWLYIYNRENDLIAFATCTNFNKDVIKGFAGTTPLLVIVDTQGEIIDIYLLENNETPAYVEVLKKVGFFEQFIGKKWGLDLPASVHAITGATLSSEAIIQTIKHQLQILPHIPQKET